MNENSGVNVKSGSSLDISSFPLNRSTLIEASAGTGKTYTITYLVLRLLLGSCGRDGRSGLEDGPLELENILVVTFTDAAASDLKKRISSKLRDARLYFEALAAGTKLTWTVDKDVHLQELADEMQARAPGGEQSERMALCGRILLKAERSIDDAAICTIHSFCNSALNQIYAFEAGETFDNRLTGDSREQLEEAQKNVWRELFYRNDNATCSEMMELLAPLNPGDPAGVSSFLKPLNRVRLSSEREGWLNLGYRIRCDEAEKLVQDMKQQGRVSGSRDRILLTQLSLCLKEYRNCKSTLGSKEAVQLKQNFLDSCTGADGSLPGDMEALEKQLYVFKQKCGSKLLKDVKGELAKLLSWVLDPASEVPAVGEPLQKSDNGENGGAGGKRGFLGHLDWKPYAKLLDPDRVKKFEDAACTLQQYLRDFWKRCKLLQDVASELVLMLIQYRCDELLRRDHLMTFDEVLRRLDRLLGDGEKGREFSVRLRRRYPVALIDEFQDTDPVQFSIFRRLYLNQEALADRAYCYLIGDPKQSIYSFRNSDLHSYLKAARCIEKLSGGKGCGQYTLDTNHRTYARTVEAVNFIFGCAKTPFMIGQDEVRFEKVKTGEKKLSFRFKNEPETETAESAGTYITLDERRPSDPRNKNKEVIEHNAAHMAADIRRALEEGLLVSEDSESRPVRPEDIAVLVRSKAEYKLAAKALADRGIASVYYSDKSSVLTDVDSQDKTSPSAEAQDLIYLMEALKDYSSFDKIVRLLLCPLACPRKGELLSRLDSSGIESESRILAECARNWEQNGFLSAFSRWLRHPAHGSLKRLLEAGEQRRLVNYYHIAEIIQSRHLVLRSSEAQLRWFCQAVKSQESDLKETLKRLESETRQVKILTIHKAKGLEFSLVFLPFLWGVEKKATSRKKNKNNSQLLNVRPYYESGGVDDGMVLDLDNSHDEEIENAATEEDVRLTYVALTRSCAANFIYVNACIMSRDEHCRSLIHLLMGETFEPYKDLTKEGLQKKVFPELKATLKKHPDLFRVTECINDDETHLHLPVPPVPALTCSQLTLGDVNRAFSISSYSSVVAGLHDRMTGNADETTERTEESQAAAAAHGPEVERFAFPRGAEPGTFLHALLEHCIFPVCRDEQQVMRMVSYRASRLDHSGILREWNLSGGDADAALSRWFFDILNTPLQLPGSEQLCLASLQQGDWIAEMDYLIPVHGTDTGLINKLCLKSAEGVFGSGPDSKDSKKVPAGLTLNQRLLEGFITGFLDLVLRFRIDGQDKYFVADYKSNYLGASFDAYLPERVRDSVFDPRNRYDVQYLFYTLALHRYLRSRLKNYSYERNFGGVMYLYLRGMSVAHPGCGIFHTLPDYRIIKKLDRMFSGGTAG